MNYLEIATYAVIGGVSWFVKLLWKNMSDMKQEIDNIKLDVASNYTKKDDLKDAIAEFKDSLRESHNALYDKINKIDDYLRDHQK